MTVGRARREGASANGRGDDDAPDPRLQAKRHPDWPKRSSSPIGKSADLGRFEQAEDSYHEALRLRPGYAEAHTNLGCALKEQGRVEEALACYDLALCLEPGSLSARYNRALTLLQAGRWEEGW